MTIQVIGLIKNRYIILLNKTKNTDELQKDITKYIVRTGDSNSSASVWKAGAARSRRGTHQFEVAAEY